MAMAPGQFMVNVFSEIEKVMTVPYDLYIIDGTIDELNKLMVLGKQKDKQAAKLGLALLNELLKQKSLKMLAGSSYSHVDDAIVDKCSDTVFVATMDRELKTRCKKKGASIITLKQKKYLVRE